MTKDRDIHLEFVNRYEYYRKQKQRVGQAVFNALYDIDSEMANDIRGGEYDCFYNDGNVGIVFNMFCEKHK